MPNWIFVFPNCLIIFQIRQNEFFSLIIKSN
uniref:II RNA helicase NPH-II n=1 Tax=Myoviridae sp. ctj3P51 TaxID=2826687 RepID=A0A8S5NPZ1_9CAUD|nr:MAG TPA: II RNA helicase NPH-II [Myoviridae sp. ctj3P51]